MSVTKETVEQSAKLAMLKLDDTEITEATSSINKILSLVDELQSVDTAGISPMAHPLDAVQYLREDTVTSSNRRDSLLANAPSQEDGQFLVPRVVE